MYKKAMMNRILFLLVFLEQPFGFAQNGYTQCDPFFQQPLSTRPANYEIHVTLDDRNKTLLASQTIWFTNQSPVPIQELRFYLYLNAFKNTESTFLKGAPNIFGRSYTDRKQHEWGWVSLDGLARESNGGAVDLMPNMRFIQPDDGNTADQSVLEVSLDKALMPGETAVIHLNWHAQIPKTIARAGYSKDFFFFCHWFPQLGVFEARDSGKWGWNCHQFFRQTEFFADFGVYDVFITTADTFVMGASGCLVEEQHNGNATTTRHYHAEDVIDFAWSAYPHFTVLEDRWHAVQIRVLLPPEHAAMGPRYLQALKFALDYLEDHVGKYPYPSITVVDPPLHGLRSGLMEYPTLVTAGTFYGIPKQIRTSESLVVHEFVHQYFMGMVASNEKEEPWLDEGFVTYFEDRIIDAAYGNKHALLDILGVHFDNRELTRLEYSTMRNPREGVVARPAWLFSDSNRKSLIYSKTATGLRTVQELVGEVKMDAIIRSYFERWKFKHPRGRDFMAVLKSELRTLPDTVFGQQVYDLFEKCIYQAMVLDYGVTKITHEVVFAPQGVFGESTSGFRYEDGSGPPSFVSKVAVQRLGDWVFPVEIKVVFEDGGSQILVWSGEEGLKVFEFAGGSRVVSAQVDPGYKLGVDVDWNNNSMTLKPEDDGLWRIAATVVFWVLGVFHAISFLG
jgi:hypothetical protein